MKKILLAVIALAVASEFLSGGQIKNFVELKKTLEEGKTVSFISKSTHIDPSSEETIIREIGYHISEFVYDGEVIRTSKEMLIFDGDKYEILVLLPTFKSDDSVSVNVNAIDPKANKKSALDYTITGKINNGSNSGTIRLFTTE